MAPLCAAVALALCASLAVVSPSAGGAEATIAKKKCKKGKKGKASAAAKKKCKGRSFVPGSGNYNLQASDGRWIGGLMRYERLGLYPDPRPYLGSPVLHLRCSDNRGNYFPAMEIEGGFATHLTKKARQFDFSGPTAGDPRMVTGTVRITGRWVTHRRIVGTLQVTNVSYDESRVPADEGPYPYYAYSCLNEYVDYVAYR